jgi:flagellin
MLSINTNVYSLTAQAALSNTQNPLQTAMERLSTGLRINSAADDAAGLAIATGLQSQINGMNTAVTNANNGVGLLQTAQGALTSITNNLQTIRELAVEAANSTNNGADLASLNTEAQQLLSEVNRVASTTQFNNVNLLDGSFQNATFQVGANTGQTITIAAIASALTSGSNSTSFAVTGSAKATAALTSSSLSINGVDIGSSVNGAGVLNSTGMAMDQTDNSAWAIANAINAAAGTGVTATADAVTTSAGQVGSVGDIVAGGITINGVSIGSVTAGSDSYTQTINTANAINNLSAQTGVTATVTQSGGAGSVGYLTLTDSEGGNIVVAGAASAAGLAGTYNGYVTLTSNSNNVVVVGSAITAAGIVSASTSGVGIGTYTNDSGMTTSGTGLGLSGLSLATQAGANNALTAIDAALNSVNESNASLGAYQDRFQSAVTTLQNTSNNLSSAKSNIMDADYATETSNMTKAMIAQQAGVSILAQANTIPQQILSLLPKS